MAEEIVWLFIVLKLKIIFNFICQESAPFLAMMGAQIFSRTKRGEKTGGQRGRVLLPLDCLLQRRKNLKPTGRGEVYVSL
jgi:hypothetical protein